VDLLLLLWQLVVMAGRKLVAADEREAPVEEVAPLESATLISLALEDPRSLSKVAAAKVDQRRLNLLEVGPK
jgi:hypothetical protein